MQSVHLYTREAMSEEEIESIKKKSKISYFITLFSFFKFSFLKLPTY